MQKRIPVFDFKIDDLEKTYIKDCLDKSFVGQGFYVKEFEKKFSNFVNCKYGITTTSGTTALHLALKMFHQARLQTFQPLKQIVLFYLAQ